MRDFDSSNKLDTLSGKAIPLGHDCRDGVEAS